MKYCLSVRQPAKQIKDQKWNKKTRKNSRQVSKNSRGNVQSRVFTIGGKFGQRKGGDISNQEKVRWELAELGNCLRARFCPSSYDFYGDWLCKGDFEKQLHLFCNPRYQQADRNYRWEVVLPQAGPENHPYPRQVYLHCLLQFKAYK